MTQSQHSAGLREVLTNAWRRIDARPGDARQIAETLLRDRPGDAEASLLLAAALWREGEAGAAHRRLAPFMHPGARSAPAWYEWAMILLHHEDEQGAELALTRATALAPDFSRAWRTLGDLRLGMGNAPAAGQAYAAALHASTTDPVLKPAALSLAKGDAAGAQRLLVEILRRFPDALAPARLLAEAEMRAGDLRAAETLLSAILQRRPDLAEAHHSFAVLLYTQNRHAESVAHWQALLRQSPHQPQVDNLLANAFMRIGDSPNAAAVYAAMLAASPVRPKTWLFYGHALASLGEPGKAADAYRKAAEQSATEAPAAFLSIADLKTERLTAEDVAAMNTALAAPAATPFQRAQLHYALGQASDQQADYAAAFRHFQAGAKLRRAATPYDREAFSRAVDAACTIYSAAVFAGRANSPDVNSIPIFILGLPRSGSTLVEQILSSHPLVEATGELSAISDIADDILGKDEAAELPRKVAALDASSRAALGQRYMAATRQFRRLARPFFTDKMPVNVRHIGLIRLILPNARLIDVRRAPMAAGFAIYRQFFQLAQPGLEFSYDLADIGAAIGDYRRWMDHLAAALPNAVHTVQYESLVGDTEREIRALLAHCGLAFDPACLRWWDTARPVHTPSAQQVRQPVTFRGLDAWRRYEAFLGPLKQELSGLA